MQDHEPSERAPLASDAATADLLQRFGFDRARFERLRARMGAGEMSAEANRVRGELSLPGPGDIEKLPALGSAERQRLEQRGLEAITAGEVGAVVLAGGMATRFGGVVKAGVEALPGQSFLALKLAQLRALAEGSGRVLPVYLMSSFATDAALRQRVADLEDRGAIEGLSVEVFAQFISLRLTPEGELFIDPDSGAPSPYAPGHGDLGYALQRSGALTRFREAGGRLLCMSNVDNLAATLDPALVGAHLDKAEAHGRELTVEVVARRPGEPGGAPARIDGVLQIVEDFRFPEGFDLDSIPYFNTNSFVIDAAALERERELTWFLVRKQVAGRAAIQFEHLVGELSASMGCGCIEVERDGGDGRFQPAKDPDELALRRAQIESILRSRGVLPSPR
ncbi:MAG: UTP--glucose-1-phosphate uridylyltransferase [Myxococcales bacterium]|nr:UTP--glucose-1-phosphate uridylyltransferase [Myxococcales bacterium]